MGTSAGEYWHIVATELPFDFPRTEPDESAPQLQARHPDLVVKLRETQTKGLVEELVAGDLHAVMLLMLTPEADI